MNALNDFIQSIPLSVLSIILLEGVLLCMIGLVYLSGQNVLRLKIRQNRTRRAIARLAQTLETQHTPITNSDMWIAEQLDADKRITTTPLSSILRTCKVLRRLASPNISAAITTITQQEAERVNALRGTPNALLLLGIFGTVLGLALTVMSIDLQGLVSQSGASAPTIFLERILGSLRLAFLSTLAGALASIAINSWLSRLSKLQADVLSELENFTTFELVPRLFPANLESEVQDLRGVMSESHVSLRSFEMTLTQASQTMREITRTMQGVASDYRSYSSESLSELSGLQRNLDTNLARVVGRLEALEQNSEQRLNRSLETQVRSYDALAQELNELSRGIIGALGRVAEHIEESGRDFSSTNQQTMAVMKRTGEDMRTLVNRLDERSAWQRTQQEGDMFEASTWVRER